MPDFINLTKAGIDMESLMKRLMNNESLVSVFINKFIHDNTFSDLKTAISENDMQKAEFASHTLKGMCGNLSLTELYKLFTKQVDLIREGDFQNATAMMEVIENTYNQSVEFMKIWLRES